MKNKKIIRNVYRIALPHWLSCAAFLLPLMRAVGDESDDTPTPVTEGNPRAGNRAGRNDGRL